MKINPEKKEELKLDVKGYGCWDDCQVFYAHQTNIASCGWTRTAEASIFS
ncbi:hypothetical protein [Paenibacillus durus]|nr:hypothetical protein [Paenibacillus durus]